jgi:hypothetical protein
MRWIETCERLDAHYDAHRRALQQLLGSEVIVVRRGADDDEEPWSEKPAAVPCECGHLRETSTLPGPPPASYALQIRLDAGIVVQASDHFAYGLRYLAQPVEALARFQRWQVAVLRPWNTRGDWRDAPVRVSAGHPRRALVAGHTLVGGHGGNSVSTNERQDVERLASAVGGALADAHTKPRRLNTA